MKTQSYQERVRALAEKMAPIIYSTKLFSIHWEDNANKEPWVKHAVPAARIAVEEMAEISKAVFIHHHERLDEMNDWLKERGLIPDDGQPDIEPVRPGDRIYGHKPHNPDNPEPETEAIVERFEAIDEEGPEVRVTLSCGYRARFWLMGLSEEEYIRRTQCMKEIDHGRDNMKIKSGQEAGKDE